MFFLDDFLGKDDKIIRDDPAADLRRQATRGTPDFGPVSARKVVADPRKVRKSRRKPKRRRE